MFMHHNALCTSCIALYFVVSYLHFCVRPRGAQTRGTVGASTSQGRYPLAVPRQIPMHLTLFFGFVIILSYFLYDS
jgi:hypothetical protein